MFREDNPYTYLERLRDTDWFDVGFLIRANESTFNETAITYTDETSYPYLPGSAKSLPPEVTGVMTALLSGFKNIDNTFTYNHDGPIWDEHLTKFAKGLGFQPDKHGNFPVPARFIDMELFKMLDVILAPEEMKLVLSNTHLNWNSNHPKGEQRAKELMLLQAYVKKGIWTHLYGSLYDPQSY